MAQDAAAALPDVLMPQRGQEFWFSRRIRMMNQSESAGTSPNPLKMAQNVEIVLVTNGDFS